MLIGKHTLSFDTDLAGDGIILTMRQTEKFYYDTDVLATDDRR
jgi:hypothetical protein